MTSPLISGLETQRAHEALISNKGAGPNVIHPEVLKLLSPCVASAFIRIFNLSPQTLQVLDYWCHTSIVKTFP